MPRIRPSRLTSIALTILAFLAEPRSIAAVAEHVGQSGERTRSRIDDLRRLGLVVRVGYGTYAQAGRGIPLAATPQRRPQPMRDAIMAFLSQPRTAKAIAEHIHRPVPTATGHLAAMRRRGLVVRPGHATYARADDTAVADAMPAADRHEHGDAASA